MRRLFVIFLCGLISPVVFAAGRSGLLDHDTFMEMENVRSPVISPDGSQIIFSRSWVDKMTDRSASNLWIVDSKGEQVRELTNGSWRDSSPVWAPDGKRLAFLSDRDGSNQLHVLWVATREVAQLTHLQQSPGSINWSPDGKQIAFTAFVPDKTPILPVKLPARPDGAKWATGATIINRLSWRRDGRGPVAPGFTHIFTIDALLGGTPRQVTEGNYNHSGPEWADNGRALLISGIRKPDAAYLRNDSEIYKIDLATSDIRPLTSRLGPDSGPTLSPDGRLIAYTGYDDKRSTRHLSSLYVMDSNGDSKQTWADNLPNSPGGVTWAPDSSGVYYEMAEEGSDHLYFAPVNGSPRRVLSGVQTLGGFSLAKNLQVATVYSDFKQPGYLATFNLNNSNGSMKKLVDVNNDVMEGVKLGDAEEIWYNSADGLRVQGWLIKPANFDPSKKYPMLLWIHGGPWSMYGVGFNWAFQNFAAEGYAVLYTNPRGSTGYGQDFVNGIQYSYPGKDYDDLMAGVDAAISKGWIDAENLFVCGGSGGGVLTAWIVGHTGRFAGAVSMRPVINWHSFVGTTDGAGWYDQFRKNPWEDPMEYAVRSPLHYVANVTTPTMVMTGEADLRTPMSQSEEYYRALKKLKKETLLVRMPDEFHGWRRPSHRLLQQLYLQAWFGQHMRGQAAPTEEGSGSRNQ